MHGAGGTFQSRGCVYIIFFARCFERELTPIPPVWIIARVDVGLGANDRAMKDAFVIPTEA
jgi:hypothetical protein